ncbi:FixH family protein [Evansella cellulosilytica]|uniref:YtkA-like domain-containing protein n=1 Tax=Evansella cellulosilytica (strain ATCC 21833 / DSM 2522 / FERM P-1141 / JCM 9156 / N-4) TaxID=649639 RepID=E6U1E9_EVAC2|nr:FixH family protein [Evansella cellulosilytica]ADU29196.1 hypothetical protein Bcell_0920 [Evansella cellulosilytica DSM 2522]
MKKTVLYSLLVVLLIAFLSACGHEDHEEEHADDEHGSNELNFDIVEVEILMEEEVDPNTEISIQAYVTQGDDKVNDASEVMFEIWEQGAKEESDFIEATLTEEDGVYEITYVFSEENLYFVQPHVTARGMHVMPVGEIRVGDVQEIDEEEMDGHEHGHDHGDGYESEHHAHPVHEDLFVEWHTVDSAKENEEVEIFSYIEWQDEPWTDGRVRYEVYKEFGDETHTWLTAEEIEDGKYSTTFQFEITGDYQIVIHIEDENIHEHIHEEITIE